MPGSKLTVQNSTKADSSKDLTNRLKDRLIKAKFVEIELT